LKIYSFYLELAQSNELGSVFHLNGIRYRVHVYPFPYENNKILIGQSLSGSYAYMAFPSWGIVACVRNDSLHPYFLKLVEKLYFYREDNF